MTFTQSVVSYRRWVTGHMRSGSSKLAHEEQLKTLESRNSEALVGHGKAESSGDIFLRAQSVLWPGSVLPTWREFLNLIDTLCLDVAVCQMGNSLPLESYPLWGEGNRQNYTVCGSGQVPVLPLSLSFGSVQNLGRGGKSESPYGKYLSAFLNAPAMGLNGWNRDERKPTQRCISELGATRDAWALSHLGPSVKPHRTHLKCFPPRYEKREWEIFTHQLLIPWVRVFPENLPSMCRCPHGRTFCCGQRRKQKLGNTDEVKFCLATDICSWFPWQQDAGAKRDRKETRRG